MTFLRGLKQLDRVHTGVNQSVHVLPVSLLSKRHQRHQVDRPHNSTAQKEWHPQSLVRPSAELTMLKHKLEASRTGPLQVTNDLHSRLPYPSVQGRTSTPAKVGLSYTPFPTCHRSTLSPAHGQYTVGILEMIAPLQYLFTLCRDLNLGHGGTCEERDSRKLA